MYAACLHSIAISYTCSIFVTEQPHNTLYWYRNVLLGDRH